jgi:hypothetical protein
MYMITVVGCTLTPTNRDNTLALCLAQKGVDVSAMTAEPALSAMNLLSSLRLLLGQRPC